MHPGLRSLALWFARTSGAVRAARWFNRRELLVLTYHGVVSARDQVSGRFRYLYRNCVLADQFKSQMRYLRRHYTLLDAEQLANLSWRGELPPRAAAVTFDDALQNNYTVAAPILRAMNIPAVFFAPTGFVDAASRGRNRLCWTDEVPMRVLGSGMSAARAAKRVARAVPGIPPHRTGRTELLEEVLDQILEVLKGMRREEREEYLSRIRAEFPTCPHPGEIPADSSGTSVVATMTWDQLRMLDSEGMGVGSHTVNHVILARVSVDEARQEIEASWRRIAEEVGPASQMFAYPNGQQNDFRNDDVTALERAGYQIAFTQVSGLNSTGQNPLTLRRVNIPGDCSLNLMAFRASGLYSALRRLRS